MIEGSLQKSIVLNGTDSVATFKEQGAVYRIDAFSLIQEINLYNLVKDRTKIFKLDDRLTKDYEIVGITVDIPEDDGNADVATDKAGEQPKVKLGIRIFSNAKAIDNIQLELTPYPFYTNKLFINHRDVWHIKCDRDVTRITYKCKPVYMEQPIVFP